MPTATARTQTVTPSPKRKIPMSGASPNPRASDARPWSGRRPAPPRSDKRASPAPTSHAEGPKPEAEILFQKYFHSVGPRTYAAQVKRAGNGNHFLVLTEGKRDEATGEVRKTRLFVFSEDFGKFFQMLHETAKFIREHPVPDEVKEKRARFWAKKNVQK